MTGERGRVLAFLERPTRRTGPPPPITIGDAFTGGARRAAGFGVSRAAALTGAALVLAGARLRGAAALAVLGAAFVAAALARGFGAALAFGLARFRLPPSSSLPNSESASDSGSDSDAVASDSGSDSASTSASGSGSASDSPPSDSASETIMPSEAGSALGGTNGASSGALAALALDLPRLYAVLVLACWLPAPSQSPASNSSSSSSSTYFVFFAAAALPPSRARPARAYLFAGRAGDSSPSIARNCCPARRLARCSASGRATGAIAAHSDAQQHRAEG